jgi:hypothetical protein
MLSTEQRLDIAMEILTESQVEEYAQLCQEAEQKSENKEFRKDKNE